MFSSPSKKRKSSSYSVTKHCKHSSYEDFTAKARIKLNSSFQPQQQEERWVDFILCITCEQVTWLVYHLWSLKRNSYGLKTEDQSWLQWHLRCNTCETSENQENDPGWTGNSKAPVCSCQKSLQIKLISQEIFQIVTIFKTFMLFHFWKEETIHLFERLKSIKTNC